MRLIIFVLSIVWLSIISLQSFAQNQYRYHCNAYANTDQINTPFGLGMNKPMKTLPLDDPAVFFRVLIVYVEFQNDSSGYYNYWAPGSKPVYADSFIAPQKETGIDAYQNYHLSNYFNKFTRDMFDMVGEVKHIILPYDYEHYSRRRDCYIEAMYDVVKLLDTSSNINYRVNWNDYDLWKWSTVINDYTMEPDGYIDMMYVQFRKDDMCGIPSGGHAGLGISYQTINGNKFINGCSICITGSGFIGINGWRMAEWDALAYFRHEFSHYTLGNHRPYSSILGGDGYNTICGSELGYSPQDLITVGLDNLFTYNGTESSFDLRDMMTTGDILKIPVDSGGQYFLIANRQRSARLNNFTWDCNMLGDTASSQPFRQFNDYSKGLYIYHVMEGNDFESWVDLEAADGLWMWAQTGITTPDWSDIQTLPVLTKTAPAYDNDNPVDNYYPSLNRYYSRDGQSVISQEQNPYPGWGMKWFSAGKRHTVLGEQGTDRVFTNNEENWCSRECLGDRWDAWAVGYNQVFSPYSSPNTKSILNGQTGIFIYLKSMDDGTANIRVYQADSGTAIENLVLELTPPSKPMLYRIEPANCMFGSANPKITWENNREPDMLEADSSKSYRIYRAYSFTSGELSEYEYVTSYNDFSPYDTAGFTDNMVQVNCDSLTPPIGNIYFRYKVVAVDKYGDSSVMSDFRAIRGAASWLTVEPKNNEIPSKFSITNYPNPFNPATVIKYSLPQKTYVTLKVYNILGELVTTLVNNEFKQAGIYHADFNGANLASGIYFYTFESGLYRASKKMVLIK